MAQHDYYNNDTNTVYRFVIRIKPNLKPNSKSNIMEEQAEIMSNIKLFKELVYRRIEKGYDLVNEDALEEAINMSGGNIRQYLRILSESAFEAYFNKSKKIYKDHVQTTVDFLGGNMKEGVTLRHDRRKVLEHVYKHHDYTGEYDKTFVECLQSNFIIYNKNGNLCYWVNPFVESLFKNKNS